MNALRISLFQWRTLFLLSAGLFIRLVLSPFPGFYGDTNVMVQYSRVMAQKGLFAVSEIPTTELYPAGFIYHNYLLGEAMKSKLRNADEFATTGMLSNGISMAERIGVRIFPIGYDVLIGALLMIVVTFCVSQRAGEWAAAVYLFNPGAVVNSALWNYDPMAAFYLLVAVVFLGVAVVKDKTAFWILAWVFVAVAMSTKLHAGMMVPLLGLVTLFSRRLKLIVLGPLAFIITLATIFAPFLLGKQTTYFKRVFVDSFGSYAVTHAGAYNLWALWFQRPVTNRLAGLTYESIGRGLFLVTMLWLAWWCWKRKIASSDDGLRRISIVSFYAFAAPFLFLTRMHERYLAPAATVSVLVGFLDPRLRGLMWGVLTCYALNLVAILTQSYWTHASPIVAQAGHMSYCIIRFFCSSLLVGLFVWLALKLPKLLEPVAGIVGSTSNFPDRGGEF